MARKFLYAITFLIVLVIAAAFAYRIWGADMIRYWLVPKEAFHAQAALSRSAYDDPKMWLAHPGIANDPSRWTPTGYRPGASPRVAVFYVHPTSYIGGTHWNAPLDDAETNWRAGVFLRGQATAFNEVGEIWAPRYRQASFGAFLTSRTDSARALDLAYRDVAQAFDTFLAAVGPDRPLILAGHSQGALHLERLLRERVAGTPLAGRVVAAYVVGWPISVAADLPRLGLPACARVDQAGCILSWQSFAEPADPSLILDTFDQTIGFTGLSRRGSQILCVNPLTGTIDGGTPASANLGTLYPSADLSTAAIAPGRVPARCDRSQGGRGILLIGEPPQVGQYVLPGNNYHVYDYSLFWANVRADAGRRLAAYGR